MEKYVHNFKRKLRLTEHFANENNITFDEETYLLVKNKDTFHPPPPSPLLVSPPYKTIKSK